MMVAMLMSISRRWLSEVSRVTCCRSFLLRFGPSVLRSGQGPGQKSAPKLSVFQLSVPLCATRELRESRAAASRKTNTRIFGKMSDSQSSDCKRKNSLLALRV